MTNRTDKQGTELSGEFYGPVTTGSGDAINLSGSQGAIINPQGPVTQYFYQLVQRYPLLRDDVYDVSGIIKSVTKSFVGREFVFEWLEEQLQTLRCGYLRLVAGAGLGKTAIAAEVAQRYKQRYGAIVHFVNKSKGVTSPAQCLKHLCASLIARYDLPNDHLPERAGQDAMFLQSLLQEVAEKRDNIPVLLVIDALDEADPVEGRNWLLLPSHLPQGVYVFLTHRPGKYPIYTDSQTLQPEPLVITESDPRHQADICAYLKKQAERPEIRFALEEASPPIPIEQFVDALEVASSGNFMYLNYVLADITAKKTVLAIQNLQGLPSGLDEYYEQFWQQTKPRTEAPKGEWESWETEDILIWGNLGVAGEAVSATWLSDQTGLSQRYVQRVLKRWQRFLRHEGQTAGMRTWSIIHRSFADFLSEKMDLRMLHRQIAFHYLEAWGGLEAGLPGLQNPELRDLDNGYGLRYMVSHLMGAQCWDDLHTLLCMEHEVEVALPLGSLRAHLRRAWQQCGWRFSETWYTRFRDRIAVFAKVLRQRRQRVTRSQNAWYEAKVAAQVTESYLIDLERVWRHAELVNDVPLQVRSALCYSSVRTINENLPPALICEAFKRNKISLPQAMTLLWERPEEIGQAAVLTHLAPVLAEKKLTTLLLGALTTVRKFKSRRAFLESVTGLLPYLPVSEQETVTREVLVDVRRVPDATTRVRYLISLARFLPKDEHAMILGEALAVACGMPFDYDISAFPFNRLLVVNQQISELLANLDKSQEPSLSPNSEALLLLAPPTLEAYPALAQTALEAALLIDNEYDRCKTIGRLVGYARDDPQLKQKVLVAGMTAVREIDNVWRQREAADSVADPHYYSRYRLKQPRFYGLSQEQAYDKALSWARKLPPRSPYCYLKIRALIHIWPHLPTEEQKRVLQEIVNTLELKKVDSDDQFDSDIQQYILCALLEIIPYLPPDLQPARMREALALLWRCSSTHVSDYLLKLAKMLARYPQFQAEALEISRRQNSRAHAITLARLLPYLTVPELCKVAFEEAWAKAQFIHDDSGATIAFGGLAPYPPEPSRTTQLEETFEKSHLLDNDLEGYMWAILVPRLRGVWRERAIQEALSGPACHAHKAIRVLTIKHIAPYMPKGWVKPDRVIDDQPGATARARGTGQPLLELWIHNSWTTDPYLYGDLWSYYTVLIALWPQLPADLRDRLAPEQLFNQINDHNVEKWQRILEFSKLARCLSEPLQQQLWAALEQLADELSDDAYVIARGFLAARLPAAERKEALQAALLVIKQNRNLLDAILYAETLIALFVNLPDDLLWDALLLAREIQRGGYVDDELVRALTLSELCPQLIARSRSALLQMWLRESDGANLLHSIARHSRSELLADLGALAPVLFSLSDEKSIAEIRCVIQDVRRWWP